MAKIIISIISILLITSLALIFLIEYNSVDRDLLGKTFTVDAVYHQDEGYVEISFFDNSNKTQSVVLEILGMPETFQKKLLGSEFTERVAFSSTPKYGWKTNPVTFVVEHDEFGKIGIKTEIHSQDESPAPIIFSKL
jgi:hypothetical protein